MSTAPQAASQAGQVEVCLGGLNVRNLDVIDFLVKRCKWCDEEIFDSSTKHRMFCDNNNACCTNYSRNGKQSKAERDAQLAKRFRDFWNGRSPHAVRYLRAIRWTNIAEDEGKKFVQLNWLHRMRVSITALVGKAAHTTAMRNLKNNFQDNGVREYVRQWEMPGEGEALPYRPAVKINHQNHHAPESALGVNTPVPEPPRGLKKPSKAEIARLLAERKDYLPRPCFKKQSA